jgi:hypothetical protein
MTGVEPNGTWRIYCESKLVLVCSRAIKGYRRMETAVLLLVHSTFLFHELESNNLYTLLLCYVWRLHQVFSIPNYNFASRSVWVCTERVDLAKLSSLVFGRFSVRISTGKACYPYRCWVRFCSVPPGKCGNATPVYIWLHPLFSISFPPHFYPIIRSYALCLSTASLNNQLKECVGVKAGLPPNGII